MIVPSGFVEPDPEYQSHFPSSRVQTTLLTRAHEPPYSKVDGQNDPYGRYDLAHGHPCGTTPYVLEQRFDAKMR